MAVPQAGAGPASAPAGRDRAHRPARVPRAVRPVRRRLAAPCHGHRMVRAHSVSDRYRIPVLQVVRVPHDGRVQRLFHRAATAVRVLRGHRPPGGLRRQRSDHVRGRVDGVPGPVEGTRPRGCRPGPRRVRRDHRHVRRVRHIPDRVLHVHAVLRHLQILQHGPAASDRVPDQHFVQLRLVFRNIPSVAQLSAGGTPTRNGNSAIFVNRFLITVSSPSFPYSAANSLTRQRNFRFAHKTHWKISAHV